MVILTGQEALIMDVPHTGGSLFQVFWQITDPRNPKGKIYPLASILTLIATAMLCGARSLGAIAEWGEDYNELLPLLGLDRRSTKHPDRYRSPCISELHTVLAGLDAEAFEEAFGSGSWLRHR